MTIIVNGARIKKIRAYEVRDRYLLNKQKVLALPRCVIPMLPVCLRPSKFDLVTCAISNAECVFPCIVVCSTRKFQKTLS